MAKNKRFEARKTKNAKVKAEDTAAIWRVFDFETKQWYPKCPATNMYDAMLIADSLNNGHLNP